MYLLYSLLEQIGSANRHIHAATIECYHINTGFSRRAFFRMNLATLISIILGPGCLLLLLAYIQSHLRCTVVFP